ncbi:MAG: GTP cyclohydrolase II [Leptolyngbya sp. SIO3F4]|nr:GTP cyclohydrolase II [Leptolyngbya sp. SIO3F4]
MGLVFKEPLGSTDNSAEITYPKFSSIEAALTDIRCGRLVIVLDDESWQQKGYLVCAAQFVTPRIISDMAIWAKSPFYLAMEETRIEALNLNDRLSGKNHLQQDIPKVSAIAEVLALAVQTCLNHEISLAELSCLGQVSALGAKSGGVLVNAGKAEAAVDIGRLAGLHPAGLVCDIQDFIQSKGQQANLLTYAQQQQIRIISIAALINYRLRQETLVTRTVAADFPNRFGRFKIYGYRNSLDNVEHLALVKGNEESFRHQPVMVRVHSECLTGDVFGSLRCDCRAQLHAAMQMIEDAGQGVVVYLRQEGRGIGLVNKLKAYSLQDLGLDTVEANEKLGFKPDLRNYGIGAQILKDVGIRDLLLITNNPRKISGLKGFDLNIVERIPLITGANTHNARYLSSKAEKLGHLLHDTKANV